LSASALPAADHTITLLINVLHIVKSIRDTLEKTANKTFGSLGANNVMGIDMTNIRVGQNLIKQINTLVIVNGVKLKSGFNCGRGHGEKRARKKESKIKQE
jgi:hypothetical protein